MSLDSTSLMAAVDLARSLRPHRGADFVLAPPGDQAALHAELLQHLRDLADERAALAAELKLVRTERRSLVSAVSHNVRTPLQVLALAVDAVVAGQAAETRLSGTIARMRRAIGTLSRYLGDLDDVSRVFDRELALVTGSFVPSALLEEAAQQVKARSSQPVEITLEANALAAMACDGGRMVQLLVIFLDNAIRYGPRGALITMRALSTPDAVRFEVHDTGDGPSEEMRERLFRGLFHANTHHVGLGLYLAQGIAEAHRGKIGLLDKASTSNSGTTFYVEIPSHS